MTDGARREPAGSPESGARLRAILSAWLLAGTLDITAALVYYGVRAGAKPMRLLQGIAAGLLGASAFQGGAATAALGLACHYFIALVWTVFFFRVASRVGFLARQRIVGGFLFGIFVSVVMSFVVLPASRVGPRPFDFSSFAIATVILILAIGLPVSLVIGRYLTSRARGRAPSA